MLQFLVTGGDREATITDYNLAIRYGYRGVRQNVTKCPKVKLVPPTYYCTGTWYQGTVVVKALGF